MFPTAFQVHGVLQEQSNEIVPEDNLSVLSGALLLCLRDDDNGISEQYCSLSGGGDLQQDICEWLSRQTPQPYHPIHDLLESTFNRDPSFYESMHAMIALSIHISKDQIAVHDLKPNQRYVLEILTRADAIWQHDMTLRDRLAERGLPLIRTVFRRKLALLAE